MNYFAPGYFIKRHDDGRLRMNPIVTASDKNDSSFVVIEENPPNLIGIQDFPRRKRSEPGGEGRH